MAQLNVQAVPSNTTVTVQDSNNIQLNVIPPTNVRVEVAPVANQVVQINRGVQGASGNNNIGGYPVSIAYAQNYDALMFLNDQWTNIPQTEISDGGNF